MGSYLYQHVRIRGEARWERLEDGKWNLINLRIAEFEAVADEGLIDGIQKLRSLRDSDWSKSKDIDGAIRASRGHDDELH